MSEELIQKDLINNPDKIGKWDFYNIGATTIKQLKENGIIRNVDYGKEEKKKVDALIVQKKNVIAVIEYKKPSEFNTKAKKQKAIKQELTVAQKLKANILIATDSKETIWINVLTGNEINDEDGKILKYNFDFNDEKLPEIIEKIINSINEKNDQIKPKKLVNPTDLAKQIWQDIWSVSGATPENCLYTFVELFIFKYLSDLGVLKTVHSFDFLIGMYDKNTPEEILEYYALNIRKKIKELFPRNDIDNTTIINGTIFVSKAQKAVAGYSTVFKKVLLKFKDYGKLEHIDYDFKSQLFESFLKESISKKNWGQFFTPLKVVRAIVEMTKDDIKDGASICDPACGVGKFLLEPIKTKLDQFYKIDKESIQPKITIHGFDKGFDKDEQKTIILAKANMLIYFSDLIKDNPGLTKNFAKLFNESFTLKTNSILGTLAEPVKEEYDLILTNPPYVTSGSSNLKEEIKKDGELESYYKVNAMGVEGLFMEWIVRALKPGGKAFVVVPDGIFNRQNDVKLRKFFLDECFIDAIISLPLNTFFTTNKKTYILSLTKKINKKVEQTSPVFTYLVSEIGETRDVYRFDIEQNDLQEAVTLFSFFKGNKSNFEKINTDKRCKIQPIQKFIKNINNSWIIDNWWEQEEKIQLGIEDKQEILDVFEFSILIDDVSNTLKELSEELKEFKDEKKKTLNKKKYRVIDLFDIKKGKGKYTKKYGNQNKGKYSVYSASNASPLTHINTYDFDGKYLTWATNGFAGYIKITNGKFSINADRGLLKPKNKRVNIDYVKILLEPQLRKLAKGRKGEKGKDEFTKVYPSMIENIEIFLPTDKNGNIDIEKQKEVIDRYNVIQEIKKQVREYREEIQEINVEIKGNCEFTILPVQKVFDVKKGLSKYTNKYIKNNLGNYPVFSSQTTNEGIIGYINSYDYNTQCLTWTTDGVHAGTVFLRKSKFSMTTHCGALLQKEENKIDLGYLYFYLKTNLKKYAVGEQNKRITVNIIKKIDVEIPVKPNGEFDLEAQKEIANKYKKIEEIKKIIDTELKKIEETKVDYE